MHVSMIASGGSSSNKACEELLELEEEVVEVEAVISVTLLASERESDPDDNVLSWSSCDGSSSFEEDGDGSDCDVGSFSSPPPSSDDDDNIIIVMM